MDEKPETTPETQTPQWAAIDQATLTPLVQSALNSETVEVIDWHCEQLHGGAGAGNAVYHFAGKGRDQGQEVPWSLILKTIHPAGGNPNASAWNYYRREADAYQSGWLDDVPGGLAESASAAVGMCPMSIWQDALGKSPLHARFLPPLADFCHCHKLGLSNVLHPTRA